MDPSIVMDTSNKPLNIVLRIWHQDFLIKIPARWCQLLCFPEFFEVLRSKFSERIISGRANHYLLPCSSKLSHPDFSFGSEIIAHFIRCEHLNCTQTIILEDFAVNMSEDNIHKRMRHTEKRAELSRDELGWRFENLSKEHKCTTNNNSSNVFLNQLIAL